MLVLRRLAVAAACLASATASTGASAGAKDENAAEWLAPKWFNEWHDGLAAKTLDTLNDGRLLRVALHEGRSAHTTFPNGG